MKAPRSATAATRLRQDLERRRQARGLIVLALVALIFSVLRFGLHREFALGWWRLW